MAASGIGVMPKENKELDKLQKQIANTNAKTAGKPTAAELAESIKSTLNKSSPNASRGTELTSITPKNLGKNGRGKSPFTQKPSSAFSTMSTKTMFNNPLTATVPLPVAAPPPKPKSFMSTFFSKTQKNNEKKKNTKNKTSKNNKQSAPQENKIVYQNNPLAKKRSKMGSLFGPQINSKKGINVNVKIENPLLTEISPENQEVFPSETKTKTTPFTNAGPVAQQTKNEKNTFTVTNPLAGIVSGQENKTTEATPTEAITPAVQEATTTTAVAGESFTKEDFRKLTETLKKEIQKNIKTILTKQEKNTGKVFENIYNIITQLLIDYRQTNSLIRKEGLLKKTIVKEGGNLKGALRRLIDDNTLGDVPEKKLASLLLTILNELPIGISNNTKAFTKANLVKHASFVQLVDAAEAAAEEEAEEAKAAAVAAAKAKEEAAEAAAKAKEEAEVAAAEAKQATLDQTALVAPVMQWLFYNKDKPKDIMKVNTQDVFNAIKEKLDNIVAGKYDKADYENDVDTSVTQLFTSIQQLSEKVGSLEGLKEKVDKLSSYSTLKSDQFLKQRLTEQIKRIKTIDADIKAHSFDEKKHVVKDTKGEVDVPATIAAIEKELLYFPPKTGLFQKRDYSRFAPFEKEAHDTAQVLKAELEKFRSGRAGLATSTLTSQAAVYQSKRQEAFLENKQEMFSELLDLLNQIGETTYWSKKGQNTSILDEQIKRYQEEFKDLNNRPAKDRKDAERKFMILIVNRLRELYYAKSESGKHWEYLSPNEMDRFRLTIKNLLNAKTIGNAFLYVNNQVELQDTSPLLLLSGSEKARFDFILKNDERAVLEYLYSDVEKIFLDVQKIGKKSMVERLQTAVGITQKAVEDAGRPTTTVKKMEYKKAPNTKSLYKDTLLLIAQLKGKLSYKPFSFVLDEFFEQSGKEQIKKEILEASLASSQKITNTSKQQQFQTFIQRYAKESGFPDIEAKENEDYAKELETFLGNFIKEMSSEYSMAGGNKTMRGGVQEIQMNAIAAFAALAEKTQGVVQVNTKQEEEEKEEISNTSVVETNTNTAVNPLVQEFHNELNKEEETEEQEEQPVNANTFKNVSENYYENVQPTVSVTNDVTATAFKNADVTEGEENFAITTQNANIEAFKKRKLDKNSTFFKPEKQVISNNEKKKTANRIASLSQFSKKPQSRMRNMFQKTMKNPNNQTTQGGSRRALKKRKRTVKRSKATKKRNA